MIRELTDGIRWIVNCYETDGWHFHVSQYLVDAADGHVLIDAGSSLNREQVIDEIGAAIDGGDLDALLLTHSILPHTDNLPRIQAEWPDVEIIAGTNAPGLVGLPPEADSKVLNERRTVGGDDFAFLDPLLTDVVGSNWLLHEPTGTLFTAEGVGHYHRAGDCERTSAELDGPVPHDAVHDFHRDKLAFLGYLDPDKLRGGFDLVFDGYDVGRIAPMHGTPIEADDLDGYVDTVIESVEDFSRDWTPEQGIAGE